MNMPIGRPISPITKTNWEGVGVQPDMSLNGLTLRQDKALQIQRM